jgi:hypothetical protein
MASWFKKYGYIYIIPRAFDDDDDICGIVSYQG